MSGNLQPIGANIHNLPTDLSDSGSAQQNLMDLERTSLDTEAPPVDARKLCILGLPWDTTDEELQTYFAGFGPLESAAIIRKSRSGESRGFGFVTYQSASDAQMVLMQEHSIGGRHIDAKQALPRGNSNPNRETRLFIGKLPADLSDSELREHFENFGRVQDAYIPKDATNGKQGHRGFGFVTFSSADDVDKVLQCAHTIRDVDVAVQCAVPKDKTIEVTARTAGISKAWPFPLPESYPSSNDSLTIGVPGPSIYGSVGSGIPHYPGTTQSIWGNPRGNLKAQPSPLHDRLYPGVASTSGREQYAFQTNRILAGVNYNPLDHHQPDRNSLSSIPNSQRSSLDYTPSSKRNAQSEAFRSHSDAAVQALQGLNFGHLNQQNLGLSLALLRAQANENQQNYFNSSQFLAQPGLSSNSAYPQQSNLATNRNLPAQQPYQNSTLSRIPAPQSPVSYTPRANQISSSFGGFGGLSGPPDARAGPRMFVGKLSKDISEQDIKDYMSQFGYVLDVYMPRDKVKRTEHRGFGFVTFETPAAIERVAMNAPHRIKGSIVVVDEAAPRREDLGELGVDGNIINDGVALADNYATDMGLIQNAQSGSRFGGGMGTTITEVTGIDSPAGSHYLNGVGSPNSAASPRTVPANTSLSGLDANQFLNKQTSLDNALSNVRQHFVNSQPFIPSNGQNFSTSQNGPSSYSSF